VHSSGEPESVSRFLPLCEPESVSRFLPLFSPSSLPPYSSFRSLAGAMIQKKKKSKKDCSRTPLPLGFIINFFPPTSVFPLSSPLIPFLPPSFSLSVQIEMKKKSLYRCTVPTPSPSLCQEKEGFLLLIGF